MNETNNCVWQCNERQYSQNPALSVTTGTKGWVQFTLATTPHIGSWSSELLLLSNQHEQLLIAAQGLSSEQL